MKKLLGFALLALTLNSCNTMIGVGRDMRQLGQGMEHAAHGRNFDGSERVQEEPAEPEALPTY